MDEKDTVATLDAQILKAQIRLRATKKQPAAPTAAATESATIKSLQQDVMHENLNLQQEYLLLKRMTLGKAACDATRCHPSPTNDDHATLLRREAARARNKQVTVGLQLQRELAALLSKIRGLEFECHQQRLENRAIFRQLLLQKKEKQGNLAADSSDDENAAMETDEDDAVKDDDKQRVLVAKENVILKCLLKDLVAGSGLDWYCDARLRRILSNAPNDD